MQPNNLTEKAYRDTQTDFGHLGHAADFETWLTNNYWPDSIRERRYRAVAQECIASSGSLDVLELAAGAGDFVMYCSMLFPQHHYSAHELSEVQLKDNIGIAARHFSVERLPTMFFGPVENLEIGSGKFDVIFIKAAVHHFEDPYQGFAELYRILKPGGKVVFFEDPVVLNIPLYTWFKKRNFSAAERALGINEHIYTLGEYLDFGKGFTRRSWHLDEVLVEEYDLQQQKRSGIKRWVGAFIRSSPTLFHYFMLWRFSPVVYVFERASEPVL